MKTSKWLLLFGSLLLLVAMNLRSAAQARKGAEIAACFEFKYAIATDGRIYQYTGGKSVPPTYASRDLPFESEPGHWALIDSVGSLGARPVALWFTPFAGAGRIFDVITSDGDHYRPVVAPRGGRGSGGLVPRPVELIGNVFDGGSVTPSR